MQSFLFEWLRKLACVAATRADGMQPLLWLRKGRGVAYDHSGKYLHGMIAKALLQSSILFGWLRKRKTSNGGRSDAAIRWMATKIMRVRARRSSSHPVWWMATTNFNILCRQRLNTCMTLRELLQITERKHSLHYHARLNPENMWFDIVDMNDHVVAIDVSPNPKRAREIAATFYPGQIIESARQSQRNRSSRSHQEDDCS